MHRSHASGAAQVCRGITATRGRCQTRLSVGTALGVSQGIGGRARCSLSHHAERGECAARARTACRIPALRQRRRVPRPWTGRRPSCAASSSAARCIGRALAELLPHEALRCSAMADGLRRLVGVSSARSARWRMVGTQGLARTSRADQCDSLVGGGNGPGSWPTRGSDATVAAQASGLKPGAQACQVLGALRLGARPWRGSVRIQACVARLLDAALSRYASVRRVGSFVAGSPSKRSVSVVIVFLRGGCFVDARPSQLVASRNATRLFAVSRLQPGHASRSGPSERPAFLPEQERIALLFGQCRRGRRAAVARARLALGRRAPVARPRMALLRIGFERQPCCRGMACVAAHVVYEAVVGDAVKKGRKFGRRPIPGPRLDDLAPGLLEYVLGRCLVSAEPQEIPVQRVVMPPVEGLERVDIAVAITEHQRAVLGLPVHGARIGDPRLLQSPADSATTIPAFAAMWPPVCLSIQTRSRPASG